MAVAVPSVLPNPYQFTLDFDALLGEASTLYHVDQLRIPARMALCTKIRVRGKDGGSLRFKQWLFDVCHLEKVTRMIAKDPDRDYWISQATLRPGARNRRICSIILLNALFVDIDLIHPPKDLTDVQKRQVGELLELLDNSRGSICVSQRFLLDIERAGLPEPTVIVWSGGGLQVKWVFDAPLSIQARPRWQSAQRELADRLAELGWPIDRRACDPSRILRAVGTVNQRWNDPVVVLYENSAALLPFDELADMILPYTREEVLAYKTAAARNRAVPAIWQQWDTNREKARAEGIRPNVGKSVEKAIEDEAARMLWAGRYEFALAVLRGRASQGGIPQGMRNNMFWPIANALAYSCTGYEDLLGHLRALHQDLFATRGSGWKVWEAMNSAASVIKRLREGGHSALYRMRTETFLSALCITDEELRKYGHLLNLGHNGRRRQPTGNEGIMGFTPMRGLEFNEYLQETRRRQAEGGRYTARNRRFRPAYDESIREKARALRQANMTTREIAKILGVDQSTIVRWLKK